MNLSRAEEIFNNLPIIEQRLIIIELIHDQITEFESEPSEGTGAWIETLEDDLLRVPYYDQVHISETMREHYFVDNIVSKLKERNIK